MPVDVAHVIQDQRVVLAWCGPQHAANLLEVEAFRLRGTQQDGAPDGWHVGAFADHIHRHENL